jgi:hypothetical protein
VPDTFNVAGGTFVASGSVVATVSGGTTYNLAIKAPVSAAVMDIQQGVTATLGTGVPSTGTLQIEGVFNLTGGTNAFDAIRLNGGTLGGATEYESRQLQCDDGDLGSALRLRHGFWNHH